MNHTDFDYEPRRALASTAAMKGLLLLAIVAVLYLAADLFIPVAIALLFSLLLSPIVRYLARFRIPPAFTAAILVLGMLSVSVGAVVSLAGPAEKWLIEAPRTVRDFQRQIAGSGEQLKSLQELATEVEKLTELDSPDTSQQVVVSGPGLFENLLNGLPSVVTFAGIVTFLTYFLLASNDSLLSRVVKIQSSWSDRRRIVLIAREIQSEVSRYLATVTIINAALGFAVAFALYMLEVPNPVLWGAMVYVFNFAPYLGAVASFVVMLIVGITTFDVLGDALMVPATFLVLTILEGQLVTPSIVGKRMSLGPVTVFLSVVFWGWLWGAAGALMAVPLMTCLRVICDNVPGLGSIALLMGSTPKEPIPIVDSNARIVSNH